MAIKLLNLTLKLQGISKIKENMLKTQHEMISKILDVS